jgi:hypothetical protein
MPEVLMPVDESMTLPPPESVQVSAEVVVKLSLPEPS